MHRTIRPFALALALLFSGCAVGPNYKRPKIDAPPAYRDPGAPLEANRTASPATASLGDEKWWTVFKDPELQNLIRTALQQNYNVRIAATRVLQAQAQLTVTRSNEFPSLNASGGVTGTKSPAIPGVYKGFQYVADQLVLDASWNLDFWGQYRRATEAARASLLASEWGRRAVLTTVVANVATDYFQLREYDLELDIARQTFDSRQHSLKLTQTLANGGATSMVDVRQAQQLVETAAETIPDVEREIQQEENAISILLGENPSAIPRGLKLTEESLPPDVPAGLPSSLLERRPDIREAEQTLIAANAEIGVARAAYFPQVSLTGSGGFESIGLNQLLSRSNIIGNFAGTAAQTIFDAGKTRANVKLAKAEEQQELLTYRQTIQQAFSDVSNALIAYRKYREYLEHQQLLTEYAKDGDDLSHIRYRGGATSYLEVLTSETTYFSAELNLAQARLNEQLSLVRIYNALGGGWQQ